MITYFSDAGPVVKVVMLLLLLVSVMSWAIIIERGLLLRRLKRALREFDDKFWSGSDITRLYTELREHPIEGLGAVFANGFKEFVRLCKQPQIATSAVLDGVQRAMRVTTSREVDKLERHLGFLATVGSISPYVGLFGTVWGIMTSFHALGNVQQATIAMVAPGISEALIATAMGLFAAIPAVVAYNRYNVSMGRLATQYDNFQEEFTNILARQIHAPILEQEA